MNFRATIRPRSFLWKLWTSERRIGGTVSDVQFRRVGTDFVSVDDPLPPDDVAKLAHNNMVLLEVSALPVVAPAVPEPVQTIPPAAPKQASPSQAAPAQKGPKPKVDLRAPAKGWPA